MTKVSVFGQETEKKKGKPIELKYVIAYDGTLKPPKDALKIYENVTLYRSSDPYDVILGWDEGDEKVKARALFLGHWNDGFVE